MKSNLVGPFVLILLSIVALILSVWKRTKKNRERCRFSSMMAQTSRDLLVLKEALVLKMDSLPSEEDPFYHHGELFFLLISPWYEGRRIELLIHECVTFEEFEFSCVYMDSLQELHKAIRHTTTSSFGGSDGFNQVSMGRIVRCIDEFREVYKNVVGHVT